MNIREDLKDILEDNVGFPPEQELRWVDFDFAIEEIISYLKSQNVVKLKSGSKWYPIWNELALNKAQANWLRENFRAVEDLE